jgi:RNA polymerase sigma-70 factor (ECF subfamily)
METAHASLSEQGVITRLRSGDPKALEALMREYWAPLVRYVDGVLGDTRDSQDVVQETFIRLWARRERWTIQGSLRSLLYTVARNAALDELRRRERTSRAADSASTPSAITSPADQVVASELESAAAKAVGELPPKRREVFRLSRDEGLSYAEIASVLDLSRTT